MRRFKRKRTNKHRKKRKQFSYQHLSQENRRYFLCLRSSYPHLLSLENKILKSYKALQKTSWVRANKHKQSRQQLKLSSGTKQNTHWHQALNPEIIIPRELRRIQVGDYLRINYDEKKFFQKLISFQHVLTAQTSMPGIIWRSRFVCV